MGWTLFVALRFLQVVLLLVLMAAGKGKLVEKVVGCLLLEVVVYWMVIAVANWHFHHSTTTSLVGFIAAGVIGIVGFIHLLFVLFTKDKTEIDKIIEKTANGTDSSEPVKAHQN